VIAEFLVVVTTLSTIMMCNELVVLTFTKFNSFFKFITISLLDYYGQAHSDRHDSLGWLTCEAT